MEFREKVHVLRDGSIPNTLVGSRMTQFQLSQSALDFLRSHEGYLAGWTRNLRTRVEEGVISEP